jgi:hypothetical protein
LPAAPWSWWRGRRGFCAQWPSPLLWLLRWSSEAELPLSARSHFFGGVRRVFPEPVAMTATPVVFDLVCGDVADQASVGRGAGWRLVGAKDHRLPGRTGTPPSPGLKWRRCGGAPAARAVLRRRCWGLEGFLCNFCFVLGFSVKDLV